MIDMGLNLPVYLDNNATTPMDPRVLEEMLPYFMGKFGNAASRTHALGWEAEEAVDLARIQAGKLIGAHAQEIVFTSGATEGVNLAIKGVFESHAGKGNHIITCATEHKAVLDTCAHLERQGGKVTYLTVKPDGIIDLKKLQNAITDKTILIALMYANNEIGVLQPIKAISEIARRHQVLFFTDATQAAGKIPVDVYGDGIDLLTFSAHKMYGPKGVGALFVRRKDPVVTLTGQMDGGGHERNMRSGTLNVPGIVGFGKACSLCQKEMATESDRLSVLRDYFETELAKFTAVSVNGDQLHRLPHATNISFKNVDGENLILSANRDIAFSRSSACNSATSEPSYVLRALGLPDELIHRSFRFSFGRFTDKEQIDHALKVLSKIIHEGDR